MFLPRNKLNSTCYFCTAQITNEFGLPCPSLLFLGAARAAIFHQDGAPDVGLTRNLRTDHPRPPSCSRFVFAVCSLRATAVGGEPAAVPRPEAEQVYASMVDRMDALERMVMAARAVDDEEGDVEGGGDMRGTMSVAPLTG